MSVSSNGSAIYSTGSLKGTTDLDPSSDSLKFTSNGENDIYIQKLNEQGDFLWGKRIGGSLNDYGTKIIISGTFQGTADFDPGNGVVSRTSTGGYDVFILALDDDGDFL